MRYTFEQPSNGHRESMSDGGSFLGALLLGPLWFLATGLWAHAVIYTLLALLAITTGPLAIFFLPLLWTTYAAFAPRLLEKRYRRTGWHQVTSPTGPPSRR